MSKYIFIFLGGYCAITLAVLVVLKLVNVDIPALVIDIPRTFAASYISAHYFMRDRARMPTRGESTVFVLCAYLLTIVVGVLCIAVLGLIFPERMDELAYMAAQIQWSSQLIAVIAGALALSFLISCTIIMVSFRWFCTIKVKEIGRKEAQAQVHSSEQQG